MNYLDTDITNPFFWGFMSEAEEQEENNCEDKEKETDCLPSPYFRSCDLFNYSE